MKNVENINYLLARLQYGNAAEVSDALSELLKQTAGLEIVTKIVLDRIDSGVYFASEYLTDLIIATGSQDLYGKVKDQILSSSWTAVKLYRGRVDHLTIEKLLCERLYKVAHTDEEPLRVEIVKAMSDVGSSATLPLLESFLYDMLPGAKLHETFSESLTTLDYFKIRARSAFLKTVERAIERIGERQFNRLFSDDGGKEKPKPEPDLGLSAHATRERAEKCIAIGLPDIALFVVRRGAENIAKQAYRATNNDRDGRDASKMMLKKLLGGIKEGAIPERIVKLLHVFQTFGNLVAHAQDGGEKTISDDIARSIIILYIYTEEAFKDWLERRGGAD